jgi:hypothetical protein
LRLQSTTLLTVLLCLFVASCYSPSAQLEEQAGVAPPHKILRSSATGFFVSPNLILTARHLFNEDFLGFKCERVRAASSDGELRGADLELVGFPDDKLVDLALLRLKRGHYPASAPVLHMFDLAATSFEHNAQVIGYPYRDLWDDEVAMNLVRHDLVALGSIHAPRADAGSDQAGPQELIKVGNDGTISRIGGPATGPVGLFLVVDRGFLRPGASGSPIVDREGRLIGVAVKVAPEAFGDDKPAAGLAVDATEVDRFLAAHGLHLAIDPSQDDGSAKAPDISSNVVRLFCF